MTQEASKKFLVFAPLAAFVVLSAFFYMALQMREANDGDQLAYGLVALTSALIDKPFPEFSLVGLDDEPHDQSELALGEVTLVNIWASWCPECRYEHPFLAELVEAGVPLVGMNYKDAPEAANEWLDYFGDIYNYHFQDRDGRLGINLGVYGAPETYIVDGEGVIRYKRVGGVNQRIWDAEMKAIYLQYGGKLYE